ncbi:glycosyltransferase, partial [Patescibacteria group bacterium]|nr:glycosyltransferase [Patescibacteria group bacterium]
MRISIILPLYNEGKILATNFEKIYSYMKKNFKDFQVIMINDGSTDDTRA